MIQCSSFLHENAHPAQSGKTANRLNLDLRGGVPPLGAQYRNLMSPEEESNASEIFVRHLIWGSRSRGYEPANPAPHGFTFIRRLTNASVSYRGRPLRGLIGVRLSNRFRLSFGELKLLIAHLAAPQAAGNVDCESLILTCLPSYPVSYP
jgi:hypothetical protein